MIDDDATSTPSLATPAPPAPAQRLHTVTRGESLWRIAEQHLGNGQRWREILDLNLTRLQPGGRTLDAADPWLDPGWTLLLPTDATGVEIAAPADPTDGADPAPTGDRREIVVVAGDTLWDLAERHLGAGERYPEIVEASRHIDQGNGVHLTDPDVIDVGWHLIIPAVAAESVEESEAEHGPATHAPQAPPGETTSPGETPATSPAPVSDAEQPPASKRSGPAAANTTEPASTEASAQAATPSAPRSTTATPENAAVLVPDPATATEQAPPADSEDGDDAPSGAVFAALGAMTAAGLAALLALRRRRTLRERPPGTRLHQTADSSQAAFTRDLNTRSDPGHRTLIDRALRTIAADAATRSTAPPPLRAARLSGDATELHLYLEAPATLPQPWTDAAQGQVWILQGADLDALLDGEAPDVPAPYPVLATLGQDREHAAVLVDLERLGHLDLRGDSDWAGAVLAALAVELATSEWADDLQVTLVGALPDLPPALATPRLRHVPDLTQLLPELTSRAHRRRTQPRAAEAEVPEVLLLGDDLGDDDLAALKDLVTTLPRVGVAAITTGATSGEAWTLTPTTHGWARLDPAGIEVYPQRLDAGDYARLLAALRSADTLTEGPPWTRPLATTREPAVAEIPEPRRLDVLPPLTAEPVEPSQPHEPQEGSAATGPQAPRVLLLGDVVVTGIDASVLDATPTHLSQAIELIAYLALHPGIPADQLSADLWPDREVRATTRRSAVSRARRLLGTDPHGHPYLPQAGTDPLGNSYILDGVGSDWEDFVHLRGPDPTRTDLTDLRRALRLVRGPAFSRTRDGRTRVRANRYLWADPHALEMTQTIHDIAAETARRALLHGDPYLAAEAADAGLRASPDDERLWRYAIRAAHHQGDDGRVAELPPH